MAEAGATGAGVDVTWAQLMMVGTVAASHMTMPNHWLPYTIVGRAHNWSLRKTLLLTTAGALGHVTTTMVIAVLISTMGSSFISEEFYTKLCVGVLMALAAYYLYTYVVLGRRDAVACSTCCSAEEAEKAKESEKDGSDMSTIAAMSVIAMTMFSPCIGSMPVLFTLLTPPIGVATAVKLWATLAVVATGVMTSLVAAVATGVRYAAFARVRRHERLFIAGMLLALAGVTYFMNESHHHHHHHHHEGEEEGGVTSRMAEGHGHSCHGHGHAHAHAHVHVHVEEGKEQGSRLEEVVKQEVGADDGSAISDGDRTENEAVRGSL